MAIYHFSAKIISRARGSSAVASAAYRSASRFHDERLDRSHDFSNKAGVIHSEVMLPEGAPEGWRDRATLWNAVEAAEKRKDAQLAREIEFAIPREMKEAEGITLARDFVQREFVDNGMVADLNVHWDVGEDGEPKPHAHVMLAMREVSDGRFGAKVRVWNAVAQLEQWRSDWSAHVNTRLAELGIDASIDHRSLEVQGIGLEPQNKIGAAGGRRRDRAEDAERAEDHRRIARENGARIITEPGRGLDAITHGQATFTVRDMARFAHRHSDGKEQFDQELSAMRHSPDLIRLGKDGRGEDRFTSREMLAVEHRLEQVADRLAGRGWHGLLAAEATGRRDAAGSDDPPLRGQQQAAVDHIADSGDLAIVIGYAGSGKSTMLGEARNRWEAAGYSVRGAALSGIAAENLQGGSGIESRTIASLEYAWGKGREPLTRNDILVIDEAGMIGSRQMERVLSAAVTAGAKVVLVGDAEQLQAIEAGAAFRHLTERHGAAEISTIWRQREPWQRDSTRALATGRTGEALTAYTAAGFIHEHSDRETAQAKLIDGWTATREANPASSQLILAHTRADVAALNDAARGRLKEAGKLGGEVVVTTERGNRGMAPGDRIMFLRNERELGVKNGTVGDVVEVSRNRMAVSIGAGDDRREVRFDLKEYADLDHGYATTIHKSQGVTVDHIHMLATPGLDRHATYVAMSRHRESVSLHYGRDDFRDARALARTLSRERAKDLALDYVGEPPASYGAQQGSEGAVSVPSDAGARAERFAHEWTVIYAHRDQLERSGGDTKQANLALSLMRRELKADPALAAALRDRQQSKQELPQAERVLRMEVERARDRGLER